MEVEFRKPYDRNLNIPAPSGEKIVPVYSLVVDEETGKEDIQVTGKTNIYDFIQKSLDETLIYNIIERYNSGDISALEKITGFYGDVTNAPKNLAEAQQILINANKIFESLPLDVRAKYNHSVSEFLSAVENDAKKFAAEKAREALIAEQERKISDLQAAAPFVSSDVSVVDNNAANNGGV